MLASPHGAFGDTLSASSVARWVLFALGCSALELAVLCCIYARCRAVGVSLERRDASRVWPGGLLQSLGEPRLQANELEIAGKSCSRQIVQVSECNVMRARVCDPFAASTNVQQGHTPAVEGRPPSPRKSEAGYARR